MVKELRKTIFVALVIAGVLAACAPASSPGQVQSQIDSAVAATVQAQNQMATSVAATLTAQAPAEQATASPTLIALDLPTLTPIVATVTPFVVVPSTGGGGAPAPAKYACSWREVKPKTNAFSPGDAIDVVWVFTNTGTQSWGYHRDLDYVSGTKMSTFLGQELPNLKPGDSVTVSFDANAPMQKGLYGMQFKVEGGLCWPALNIQVGNVRDP